MVSVTAGKDHGEAYFATAPEKGTALEQLSESAANCEVFLFGGFHWFIFQVYNSRSKDCWSFLFLEGYKALKYMFY